MKLAIQSKLNLIPVLLLIGVFLLCSCKTTKKWESITGRYVGKNESEFFEFEENGYFKYNVRADAHPTEINSSPPYTGKYKMKKSGAIQIYPITIHLGLFRIKFSEEKDELMVKHRYSGRETLLHKVEP